MRKKSGAHRGKLELTGGGRKVLQTRRIPVAFRTDVLVCGGGPAGIGAAMGAAKAGAKTLLVEQYGFLGGMATAGLVLPFGDTAPAIARTLFERLAVRGAAKGWAFDPEAFKLEAAEMLIEAGAQLLLHTYFCDAIVERGAVRGAIVQSKSGCQAILADMTVDCTGDADVAASAGARFAKGRAPDGRMQPVTLMFRMGGVDVPKYKAHSEKKPKMEEALARARRRGEVSGCTCSLMGFVQVPGSCETVLNLSNYPDVDGTDAASLTRGEIETRREVFRIVAALREYVPGFEKAWLIDTAPHLGVRETRQIHGEYVYALQDIYRARKFPDAVARNIFESDIHPLDGMGRAKHRAGHLRLNKQPWSDIPYRCLVPKKVDSLLVAGRCFSATHEAMGGPRRMGPCMAMGHAAGVAAALSAKSGTPPRKLDVAALQDALRRQGVEI